MLLAAVFRHWQSPFPVSLFLGAFWWYLCSRTLHFVEARCCDVSPTSSSALCGQPAPNRRLVWFRPRGRVLSQANSQRPFRSSCIVLQYLDLYLYLYLTCTGQGAHQAQQTCKRQCARGCPPCHSKTGSPHRHLRHPPRCDQQTDFASGCLALWPSQRFCTYSQCSSPRACDLRFATCLP